MNRSTTLAIWRIMLLLGMAGVMIAVIRPVIALRLGAARTLPARCLRICRSIVGMELKVHGVLPTKGPVLFVSNHVSYIDIIALGSLIPGSFVARADIREWPVFGYLSTLQRTIYIERQARYARQQMEELGRRLDAGDQLILFPEGTSSDGNKVLPFKSSLFGVAEATVDGRAVPVQPISIAYTRLDGLPLGRLMRPIYAWYGDMDFAPHFWFLLGLGRFRVDVMFHEPLSIEGFASRKEIASHCERVVTQGFSRLIAGRFEPGEPKDPSAKPKLLQASA